MARTPIGAALTQAHRAVQARILADVVRRLAPFWEGVDPDDLRGTLDAWALGAGTQTLMGWRASTEAARAYYAALRRAEGVPGWFVVPWPDAPVATDLSGATVGSAIRGMWDAERRGATLAEVKARGLVRATGSIIKTVADGGRATILGASARDPYAIGYQRVTDGDPCAFCRMIASRGIVRYDPDKAGFKAHGHCGCTAEPAFQGDEISPQNAEYREQWKAATRGRTDALNAFRQYLNDPATGSS